MNRKDARKKTQRDMTKRGDRIRFLKSLRNDKKHKTFKATIKV